MAGRLSQQNRFLEIVTSMGEDALVLQSFQGEEGLSTHFEFQLSALSQEPNLNQKLFTGQNVTVKLHHQQQGVRLFNGVIDHCEISPADDQQHQRVTLNLRPWFHSLNYHRDCRIFQHLTVPQIVQQVLQDQGLHDFSLDRLAKDYPKIDYLTQYNETDADFINRILEEAGISFYYQHNEQSHQLILHDGTKPLPELAQPLAYTNQAYDKPHIQTMHQHRKVRCNAWSGRHYDYQQAGNDQVHSAYSDCYIHRLFENTLEDYQVRRYQSQSDPDKVQQIAQHRQTWHSELGAGSSTVTQLAAGHQLQLTDDSDHDEEQRFTVTHIRHDAKDLTHFTGEHNDNDSPQQYSNNFQYIQADVKHAPLAKTPKPKIAGVQLATVVGVKDQAIDTDAQGRVKLQFHWDRYGQNDENSSRPVRVWQMIAGDEWGSQWIPRIGDEVLVKYLQGDPDYPEVLASVYNSTNTEPYPLPDNHHISGIKTRLQQDPEKPQTDAGHELRFDDTPGHNGLRLHSEKLLNTTTKYDSELATDAHEDHYFDQDHYIRTLEDDAFISAPYIQLNIGGSQVVIGGGVSAKSQGNVNLMAAGVSGPHLVSRLGDHHHCPKLGHKGHPVHTADNSTYVNKMPVARVGDKMHCRIPGNDHISKGATNITVNGKAMAHVHSKTKHGGVITTGGSNVYVAPRNFKLPSLPHIGFLPSETNTTPGTHWIQGQYLDADGNPKTGISYTIEHQDGTIERGKLDGQGKTKKVQNLQPGTATITFGDPKPINEQLQKDRAQLQQFLDKILQGVKQQAAIQKAEFERLPDWQKKAWFQHTLVAADYINGIGDTVANGALSTMRRLGKNAWNTIRHPIATTAAQLKELEKFGKGVAHFFGDLHQADIAEQQEEQDIFSGNTAAAKQDDAKREAALKKAYAPIFKAKEEWDLLSEDPETKLMLQKFAEDYYHSETPMMMSYQAGEVTGGFGLAIITCLILKNPELIAEAAGAALRTVVVQVGRLLEKMAKLIEELKAIRVVKEADVDQLHEVKLLTKDPDVVAGKGITAEMDGHKIYASGYSPLSSRPKTRYRFSDPEYRTDTGKDVYFGENVATSYFEVRKNIEGKSLFVGNIKIDNILDLTDPEILQEMGIDPEILRAKVDDDLQEKIIYGYTNKIANQAYEADYNGILYNSSRKVMGNNKALMLFGGRYDPDTIAKMIDMLIE